MNCERIRSHAIEFSDGRLEARTEAEVRAHLARCAPCQREFETLAKTLGKLDALPAGSPSPRLRTGVFAMIRAEERALREGAAESAPALRRGAPESQFRAARSHFWKLATLQALAACGLVAVGYLAGFRHSAPPDPVTQRELADLRSKVDSMGRFVSYSVLDQQRRSANERLQGVLVSAAAASPSAATLDNLIGTLALDPSANVRLNAVEALYAHADQEVARTGVLVSLPRESNPLVQLAMIDFLVASRDHDAAPALEKLSASATADQNVRAAAKRALTQL